MAYVSYGWMGMVWGVVTAVLVILLIYRSTLTMHEDDQLFLDEAESHMEQEQIQLMKRVDRISPYLKVLGAVSGVIVWSWRAWPSTRDSISHSKGSVVETSGVAAARRHRNSISNAKRLLRGRRCSVQRLW